MSIHRPECKSQGNMPSYAQTRGAPIDIGAPHKVNGVGTGNGEIRLITFEGVEAG